VRDEKWKMKNRKITKVRCGPRLNFTKKLALLRMTLMFFLTLNILFVFKLTYLYCIPILVPYNSTNPHASIPAAVRRTTFFLPRPD
jgi:hypothetical protein